MPLARYFLYVGGVLLALLLILDAYLPQVPVSERAHVDLPLIRIHSAQKWPERVVYDTSLPTVVPRRSRAEKPASRPLLRRGSGTHWPCRNPPMPASRNHPLQRSRMRSRNANAKLQGGTRGRARSW